LLLPWKPIPSHPEAHVPPPDKPPPPLDAGRSRIFIGADGEVVVENLDPGLLEVALALDPEDRRLRAIARAAAAGGAGDGNAGAVAGADPDPDAAT
jgi:hypothetical protein